MPLNSPSDHNGSNETDKHRNSGTLYVVATPIGHRDDITIRAIRVLTDVNIVAAEDTRHTGRLLAHHGITTRLIAYHDHNENQQTPKLIERLNAGQDIALVSDAGTPGISDPGYRLVTAAVSANISVVPIPGASAMVAALSVAGLPTDSFVFIGFLPPKKTQRTKRLRSLATETRTLIFYESPKRLLRLVRELHSLMGDRKAVVAREISKLHEEFIRGTLNEIVEQLGLKESIKGECTLLVAGSGDSSSISTEAIREALISALETQDLPLSAIVKKVAQQLDVSKNWVYREALKVQNGP